MDVRVDGKKLVAPGALPFTRDEVEVRKLKPGVTAEEVIGLVRENGRDDILCKTDAGELFLVSAGKLDVRWKLGFPTEGERVKAGELEGSIVFANDERSLARLIASVGSGAIALSPLIGVGYALLQVHNANGIGPVLAMSLALPFNAILGTFVAGAGGAATAIGGSIADGVSESRAAKKLEDLTTLVGGEG